MPTRDTNDLIQQLAAGVQPVPPSALRKRLGAGLLLGAAVALLSLYLSVGVRKDLTTAVLTLPFWTKWLYVGALSVVGFGCCARLSRPGDGVGKLPLFFIVPIGLLASRAIYELQLPGTSAAALWLGHSALVCPWNIAALAVPVFISLVWTLRKLAPTRMRLAGFAAGLLSGASGAMVYALYCNESAAPFVLTWYTVGTLLPGLIGAILGPRLLRW